MGERPFSRNFVESEELVAEFEELAHLLPARDTTAAKRVRHPNLPPPP